MGRQILLMTATNTELLAIEGEPSEVRTTWIVDPIL